MRIMKNRQNRACQSNIDDGGAILNDAHGDHNESLLEWMAAATRKDGILDGCYVMNDDSCDVMDDVI